LRGHAVEGTWQRAPTERERDRAMKHHMWALDVNGTEMKTLRPHHRISVWKVPKDTNRPGMMSLGC
jgi:hypothetical protein